jgi:hypothetical protein
LDLISGSKSKSLRRHSQATFSYAKAVPAHGASAGPPILISHILVTTRWRSKPLTAPENAQHSYWIALWQNLIDIAPAAIFDPAAIPAAIVGEDIL